MFYEIYVKDNRTENVTLGNIEVDLSTAEKWVSNQQDIWGEDRGYKIVQVGGN